MFLLVAHTVGPCALDYSRTKTQDHFWTDPPADELVQRHRISGHNSNTPPVTRRPALNVSFLHPLHPRLEMHVCVYYRSTLSSHTRPSRANAGGKSIMQHAEHVCCASCIRCNSQALSRDQCANLCSGNARIAAIFCFHANRIAALLL
jgi:hypothetical protein